MEAQNSQQTEPEVQQQVMPVYCMEPAQKVEREVMDVRVMFGKEGDTDRDIGVLCTDANSRDGKPVLRPKTGDRVVMGLRKLDEMAGFYRIYGDLVRK